jgi:hypothetical protein
MKLVTPFSLPQWGPLLAIFSFGYLLIIPLSAFTVKRGIMLGASGNESYFPGFLHGSGYYAREREALSRMGLQLNEFPLDIALILVSGLFTVWTYSTQMEGVFNFYKSLGISISSETTGVQNITRIFNFLAVVIISTIALVRRKRCGRQ